jgi:hypothetical protein
MKTVLLANRLCDPLREADSLPLRPAFLETLFRQKGYGKLERLAVVSLAVLLAAVFLAAVFLAAVFLAAVLLAAVFLVVLPYPYPHPLGLAVLVGPAAELLRPPSMVLHDLVGGGSLGGRTWRCGGSICCGGRTWRWGARTCCWWAC